MLQQANFLTAPLLDYTADRSGHLFAKQPGFPALWPYRTVTAEKGLQGSCLVPAHQQLRLWILKKATYIR